MMQDIQAAFIDLYKNPQRPRGNRVLPSPTVSAEPPLEQPTSFSPEPEAPRELEDEPALAVFEVSADDPAPSVQTDSPSVQPDIAILAPERDHSLTAVLDHFESTSQTTSDRPTWLEPLPSFVSPEPLVSDGVHVETLFLPEMVSAILNAGADHWYRVADVLHERCAGGALKAVLVTGNDRSEGYTTVCLTLAVALAERTDLNVLLIDADFANPGLGQQLVPGIERGLEAVVLEHEPVEQVLLRADHPQLSVLPLGHSLRYPGLVVSRDRTREMMETLRERYDLILIDGGALLAGGAPAPLTAGVDAAVLVRHPGITSVARLTQVDELLQSKGVVSLGVIENAVAMSPAS